MEVIVDQWNDEENEVEEVDLKQKMGALRFSHTIETYIEGEDLKQETIEVITKDENHETNILQIGGSIILPSSDSPIPKDPTSSLNIVNTEIEKVDKELYLERVFEIPPTHGFYCPNCKSCIQKVYIIQGGELKEDVNNASDPLIEKFRCSSCFSFLVPLGSWLFPGLVRDPDEVLNPQVSKSGPINTTKSVLNTTDDSQILKGAVTIKDVGIGSIPRNNVTSQDQKGSVATRKEHVLSNWAVIGEAPEASIPKQDESSHSSKNSDWRVIIPSINKPTEITLEVGDNGGKTDLLDGPSEQSTSGENTALIPQRVPHLVPEVASNKALEIVKSIVYGGLTESLASLTVVTSAASADATILSIVALALANLIGGLFIFLHNLGELRAEEHKKAENQTEAVVDRYNELLGQTKNFYLHAFIAIISFIVFGLVPPLVYGFSFHENGDKDFKLGAVLVASLICITLLSIAKAYTKKSNTFVAYFKTVIYYVSNGAVGSVLSYLAGVMVKKLLEKVAWLEPSSNFGLHVSRMSVQETEWSSY